MPNVSLYQTELAKNYIMFQESTTVLTCDLERGVPKQRNQIKEDSIKLIIRIAKPGTSLTAIMMVQLGDTGGQTITLVKRKYNEESNRSHITNPYLPIAFLMMILPLLDRLPVWPLDYAINGTLGCKRLRSGNEPMAIRTADRQTSQNHYFESL